MLKILHFTLSFIFTLSFTWGANTIPAGEYSFIIMPDAESSVAQQAQNVNAYYANHSKLRIKFPRIRPHIAIMQGRFSSKDISKIRKIVRKYAASQSSFDIEMDSKLLNGGCENTFWEVKPGSASWGRLNEINKHFCDGSKGAPALIKHPVGLRRQVRDNIAKLTKQIESGEEAEAQQARETLETIRKYGRDSNIPGKNHSYIRVAYNAQLANIFPFDASATKFIAKGIYLASTYYDGRVCSVLEFFPFS